MAQAPTPPKPTPAPAKPVLTKDEQESYELTEKLAHVPHKDPAQAAKELKAKKDKAIQMPDPDDPSTLGGGSNPVVPTEAEQKAAIKKG